MSSTKYTVKRGDYLPQIARRFGFSSWEKIYEHADNADFRKRRPNPQVIKVGDELFIPDRGDKEVERATEEMHKFEIKLPPPDVLKIILRDDEGEPFDNEPFTLTVERHVHKGTTTGAGLVEAPLPPGAVKATLALDDMPWLSWELEVGHLDPLKDDDTDDTVVTGLQARLNNLGFFCGAVDDDHGNKTKAAVMQFQEEVLGREEPDGELDAETRDRIFNDYGI